MEMCYEGALVMPSSYAVMNEEEMTYVEGGMTGKARTAEERICVASFVATSAYAVSKMTMAAFKGALSTACAPLVSFIAALGGCALMAAATYEWTLAGIASTYATNKVNYNYTYYGFASFGYYTKIKAI